MTVHHCNRVRFLNQLETTCRKLRGDPSTWPAGEYWAFDWNAVNCPDCSGNKESNLPDADLTKVSVEYNDDTLMPFGKYAGRPLKSVPASYLHYLWTHRPISDKLLQAYIQKNIPALKKEYHDGIWT